MTKNSTYHRRRHHHHQGWGRRKTATATAATTKANNTLTAIDRSTPIVTAKHERACEKKKHHPHLNERRLPRPWRTGDPDPHPQFRKFAAACRGVSPPRRPVPRRRLSHAVERRFRPRVIAAGAGATGGNISWIGRRKGRRGTPLSSGQHQIEEELRLAPVVEPVRLNYPEQESTKGREEARVTGHGSGGRAWGQKEQRVRYWAWIYL